VEELRKAQSQIEGLMGRLQDIVPNDPDYNVVAAAESVREVMSYMPFKKAQKEEIDALITAAQEELNLWLDHQQASKKRAGKVAKDMQKAGQANR